MTIRLSSLTILFCFLIETGVFAQTETINDPLAGKLTENVSNKDGYVWPKDAAVLNNLKKWQGYKFGVLIHFGLYSELGIIESWALCPEDWITRTGYDDYYKFCTDYRNTKNRFNPVNFNPEKWAGLFKNSGAKYVIFTSKHHDGFCLFDSRFTDFKVTDKACPFSSDPRSNILKEVLDASRKEGLVTGIYFSKPDWNTPYFWWPYYPPKDRNPSYDITKHADRWKKYVEFTQNQINELTTEYGKVDILWLDGCWVRPLSTINKQVEEFCKYPYDMDINMKLIAERAREKQPGMLVVDRWVPGDYENYLTPEQKMPEKALPDPWESCITMGNAWGWVKDDHYKSSKEIINLLVNIVAKGGNLLLGIGPNGKGEFEPEIYENLARVGKWLQINGEAIYETNPVEPFSDGKVAYTAKGKNTVYAIYLPSKDEKELPAEIPVKIKQANNLKVSLLSTGQKLNFKKMKDQVVVSIPKNQRSALAMQEAIAIKLVNH